MMKTKLNMVFNHKISAPRPAYRVTDPVAQKWLALGKLKFALGKLARTQRQKGEKADEPL